MEEFEVYEILFFYRVKTIKTNTPFSFGICNSNRNLKLTITEIDRYSTSKTVELKPFVFALFSQNENQRLTFVRKSLIFIVDQPGLEPGTSRL